MYLFSCFFFEKENGNDFFPQVFFLVDFLFVCSFFEKSILVLLVKKGLAFWTLKSGPVQMAMGKRIPLFKYCTKVTPHREDN